MTATPCRTSKAPAAFSSRNVALNSLQAVRGALVAYGNREKDTAGVELVSEDRQPPKDAAVEIKVDQTPPITSRNLH
jgi:hypothetical protein